MVRKGWHIHFYCKLLILIVVFVIANIKPTATRGLYLMAILSIFALFQLKVKKTILFWIWYGLILLILYAYNYFSLNDAIISRYPLIISRNVFPTFFALWIFGSTPVSEITYGFDTLKFPKKTAIAVTTIFRYFPSLLHDIKVNNENIKIRGLGGIRNLFTHPGRTIKCIVLPLIVLIHKTAEELTISAIARGAESQSKRSSLYGKDFSMFDGAVLLFMLLGLGCVYFF